MPELLEIETYRRAALPTIGRTIASVQASDDWYTKRETTPSLLRAVLPGRSVVGLRRIGKLMLVDTDGPVLGLRYGMTGRIVVDGGAPIESLEYGSASENPAWDRFGLTFDDGTSIVIRDPRRLGGVELDPNEDALGPDASTVTLAPFRELIGSSRAPLKARLMDQGKLAGLGNLLVDETLFRAGLAPGRAADSLDRNEQARLHRAMRRTIEILGSRGGSHTGDLQPARTRGGLCPKDGEPLRRESVGGRTTYWCPDHQR